MNAEKPELHVMFNFRSQMSMTVNPILVVTMELVWTEFSCTSVSVQLATRVSTANTVMRFY